MEQRHTLGRATNADHPFRMLLDHLPTPAWACRPDGTTALLNQCWLDYTGLSLAQALAEGWHGPVHPDDRGPLREPRQGAGQLSLAHGADVAHRLADDQVRCEAR